MPVSCKKLAKSPSGSTGSKDLKDLLAGRGDSPRNSASACVWWGELVDAE